VIHEFSFKSIFELHVLNTTNWGQENIGYLFHTLMNPKELIYSLSFPFLFFFFW